MAGNWCVIQTTDDHVGHSQTYIFMRGEQDKKIAILIDCGLMMHSKNINAEVTRIINENFACEIDNIKVVLITHPHTDHIAMLPFLVKNGYTGPIYSSIVTRREAGTLLRDSAKILASYGEYYYTNDDVDRTTSQIVPIKPNVEFEVYKDSIVRVIAMGIENPHLPGAFSWFITIKRYDCEDCNILFSGDVKSESEMFYTYPIPKSLLKKKMTILCESTYGTTIREKTDELEFEHVIQRSYNRGGNVIIASISNERPEIILNHLLKMKKEGMIRRSTPIYMKGALMHNLYNIINNSSDVIKFKEDFEDTSEDIVWMEGDEVIPKGHYIMVVSPGMLSGGASLEAVFAEAYNEKSLLLLTSYIPEGDTAYKILHTPKGGVYRHTDGRSVRINMDVYQYTAFSGHADALGLIKFISQFKGVQAVLFNHGDPEDIKAITQKTQEILEIPCYETSRKVCFRVGPDGVEKILSSKLDVNGKTLSPRKNPHPDIEVNPKNGKRKKKKEAKVNRSNKFQRRNANKNTGNNRRNCQKTRNRNGRNNRR